MVKQSLPHVLLYFISLSLSLHSIYCIPPSISTLSSLPSHPIHSIPFLFLPLHISHLFPSLSCTQLSSNSLHYFPSLSTFHLYLPIISLPILSFSVSTSISPPPIFNYAYFPIIFISPSYLSPYPSPFLCISPSQSPSLYSINTLLTSYINTISSLPLPGHRRRRESIYMFRNEQSDIR